MSLETEVARLANVAEKGFADLEKGNYQAEMCGMLGEIATYLSELVKILRPASPNAASPEPAKRAARQVVKGVTGFTPADLSPAVPPVTEPAAAPTVAAPPAAAPTAAPAPNGQSKGPTFDEVVAIAQEVARRKTPPVAIKLINAHGAQKLADMDPAQYPAFYAAAQVELGQDPPF